jgi:hypothetical protein
MEQAGNRVNIHRILSTFNILKYALSFAEKR